MLSLSLWVLMFFSPVCMSNVCFSGTYCMSNSECGGRGCYCVQNEYGNGVCASGVSDGH